MSSQPIEWHLECLKAQSLYYQKLRFEAEQAKRLAEQAGNELNFYDEQICTAQREGKKSFDSDKFLKGRAKK